MCSTDKCVFMSRRGELIKPLASGDKAVSVSSFNGPPKIHIRRYFGVSDKKFPTRYGITMTKQEFVDLVSLSCAVLAEFDRLEGQKNGTIMLTKPVDQVTVMNSSLISDVVADSVPCAAAVPDDATVPYDAVDNAPSTPVAETPFAIGSISTLMSQPQYAYEDSNPSWEPQWGAPDVADSLFPQAYPWNINDDWPFTDSQVPDEQTIPDVSVPAVPVPRVSAPQRIPILAKRRTPKTLNPTLKKMKL